MKPEIGSLPQDQAGAEERNPSGFSGLLSKACHPTLKDEHGEPLIDMNLLEEFMLKEAERMVEKAANRVELWRAEALGATNVLDEEMQKIGACLQGSKRLKKEFTETLRTLRQNVVSEVSQITKPLKEVREFFLGANHDKEIERLREFVDLCERLKALKDSGFLDSVSDTMLKLA